jgi:hypothetical protein
VPRKSEWIEQLPSALEELRQFPASVVDRAILEKVLRIERRTAIRLMNRFGGFQTGKTFLIDRVRLIEQLEQLRKVRVDVAPDVRDRRMKDLPAGIHLKPGELRIEFYGAEDLLRHLFELSQAMVNDFGRFQAAVE